MNARLDKSQLRIIVRDNLNAIVSSINSTLRGKSLRDLKPILTRLGRNHQIPHWFEQLSKKGTLPNLDGKTIGSIIEMLFVSIVEKDFLSGYDIPPLRVNPASGVDIPDLDLGVKSPSQNFCTSEPFFFAYERLIGSEYDVVVLLTDYQTSKKTPPLKLQIIDSKYLYSTEIADCGLCKIAGDLREWLLSENESWAKKVFRFLAYINQQDWLAKNLLKLIQVLPDEQHIVKRIQKIKTNFSQTNARRVSEGKEPMPKDILESIERIEAIRPICLGVVEAADNWLMQTHKSTGRAPTDNEWHRLVSGPLDGKIGMSFALQWRYNFGRIFKGA